MRFADKSRNIRATDLTVLPYDASFKPSEAPSNALRKRFDRGGRAQASVSVPKS